MTVGYAFPSPRAASPRSSTVTRHRIGFGDYGTIQTLELMQQTVRESLANPLVLEVASQLAQRAPARDHAAMARVLWDFLATHVTYLNDPPGQETLRTPDYLLDRIFRDGTAAGDCDDLAMLAAALALGMGLPARFVTVGFDGALAPLVHVFTEVQLGPDDWGELDTTRPRSAAQPTRRLNWEV